MNPTIYGLQFAGTLFIGMLVLLESGRRLGVRRMARDADGAGLGLSVVEGAVFSVLGLLVAFTFSSAVTRFDGRRYLIIEEANDIGTAYLRLDVLPAAAQPHLRELFRKYLDSRLDIYRKLPDLAAAHAALDQSVMIQGEIWSSAVAACRDSGSSPAHLLLLPALNSMFDITTTRNEISKIHPPWIIFGMIGLFSLAAAGLAGYGMAGSKKRSWIHNICFAGVIAVTVYVIVDIEYPRFGFIRVDSADRVLIDLRESMK